MSFGQFPEGALAQWQMPKLSLVGYGLESEPPVDPPVDPPPNPVDFGSAVSVLDNFEAPEEEQKPEWKERSYRELLETMEILTMVGFFE